MKAEKDGNGNMQNDYGSHQYIVSRIRHIADTECGRKISSGMQRAEYALKKFPDLDFAFLLPTDTALRKGIIDAVRPVRELLLAHGIHDFRHQLQGVENKIVVDGLLLTDTEDLGRKISLYRPLTKTGDPRIWMFELSQHINPYDLLLLMTDGYTVYVINTATEFEKNPRFEELANRCATIDKYQMFEEELIDRLKEICSRGFIPSIKSGDTGVGMTLENLVGVDPNSYKGPDWNGIELKAHRIGQIRGRQTLFGEKPCWDISRYNASGLLDKFGYIDAKKRVALYTTIYGDHWNPQGFKLLGDSENDVMQSSYMDPVSGEFIPDAAVWRMEDVRKHLRTKHARTFWIGAETRKVNHHEEFQFVNVSITQGPDYMRMEKLIAEGLVTVDLTLTYKPNKNDPTKFRPRDHGYLWRTNMLGMNALFSAGRKIDLRN